MKLTSCEEFDGYNCSRYPHCSCTDFGRKIEGMTKDRCNTCLTPDTCNRNGCIETVLSNLRSIAAPAVKLDCPAPICGTPEICEEACIMNSDCCNDPADCNEPCNVVYPELDGRNEGPVNKHGCSYVDCDCDVPCTSKTDTTVINLTIENFYGDINF